MKTAQRTSRKYSNSHQLSFDFMVQERLERAISARLGKPVTVIFTDNASVMISFSKLKNGIALRLHHMFREADKKVIEAVIGYVQHRDRKSSSILNEFIKSNKSAVRKGTRCRSPDIDTCGKHHDLKTIYRNLNRSYFGGKLDVTITWGRKNGRKPHRHIRLGSYSYENKIIRIHPALDRDWVPGYFVESVVYHEMLHAHFQVARRGGRVRYHTPEFHQFERRNPHFDRSLKWEKSNVQHLL